MPNLCGVIITTNHKTNGLYLPDDDRRHMVAWSNLTQGRFHAPNTGANLYQWYGSGGVDHTSLTTSRTLISADSIRKNHRRRRKPFGRSPTPIARLKMPSWLTCWMILAGPDVVTLNDVANRAAILQPPFAEWLRDRKNRRAIPHRFEDCGYVAVSNPNDTEGRWKIDGTRHTIYGKASLTVRDRIAAAFKFVGAR